MILYQLSIKLYFKPLQLLVRNSSCSIVRLYSTLSQYHIRDISTITTTLCVTLTHSQFVKRFYPGGPKNLPKGHASSTSIPGNSSKPNTANGLQMPSNSNVPQNLNITTPGFSNATSSLSVSTGSKPLNVFSSLYISNHHIKNICH